jgi:hypothetical protein
LLAICILDRDLKSTVLSVNAASIALLNGSVIFGTQSNRLLAVEVREHDRVDIVIISEVSGEFPAN